MRKTGQVLYECYNWINLAILSIIELWEKLLKEIVETI